MSGASTFRRAVVVLLGVGMLAVGSTSARAADAMETGSRQSARPSLLGTAEASAAIDDGGAFSLSLAVDDPPPSVTGGRAWAEVTGGRRVTLPAGSFVVRVTYEGVTGEAAADGLHVADVFGGVSVQCECSAGLNFGWTRMLHAGTGLSTLTVPYPTTVANATFTAEGVVTLPNGGTPALGGAVEAKVEPNTLVGYADGERSLFAAAPGGGSARVTGRITSITVTPSP